MLHLFATRWYVKQFGWLANEKSDIEDLAPAQIADKYVLPKESTHICDVNVNSDINLQTGVANSVEG